MQYRKKTTPTAFVALFTGLIIGFSPWVDAAEFWTEHQAASNTSVDHSAWSAVLKASIITDSTGLNRFDYQAAAATHQQALGDYITRLENTSVTTLNKAEQKAFWINLYNALTVKLIIDNLPVDSITEIKPSFFSFGPWDKELTTIQGKQLSLNDIEHKILRPIFTDARIHYAVNCASIGCPNLQDQAFTAANTEALLTLAAGQYINHPRGVLIADDTLVLSSIYEWYGEDFGADETHLIAHLIEYAKVDLKKQLRLFTAVDDYQYDWSLNRP